MGRVIYDISMSLDGFISGANARPEAGWAVWAVRLPRRSTPPPATIAMTMPMKGHMRYAIGLPYSVTRVTTLQDRYVITDTHLGDSSTEDQRAKHCTTSTGQSCTAHRTDYRSAVPLLVCVALTRGVPV